MRWMLLILPLWLLGAPCTKCQLNKDQMRCEYYVAKKGDASKAHFCKSYADYLNDTKVYGKAAWYYLLAKEPQKAVEASQKALELGEAYAKEYMAFGYWLLGKKAKAKTALQGFEANDLTKKDKAIIQKLYNTKINLKELQ